MLVPGTDLYAAGRMRDAKIAWLGRAKKRDKRKIIIFLRTVMFAAR